MATAETSSNKSYDLTTANVSLVFGLPTTGWILQIASTPSDYPFGTLNTCEDKLLNLPVGEELCRCFLDYACATILASTSTIDGCRNLWHTIHENGFKNDVNWGQFVVDQLVEDELIKERLATKISEFGSFGHGEGFDDSSPPRTHVEAESGSTSSHVRILLDAQRERSVPLPVAGHSGYAANDFPQLEQHSHYARDNMACHGTKDVPDTPIRHLTVIADEEVLVYDHFPLCSMIVAPSDRSGRRRRVRRMAPNLLSSFIVEELVSMHDTSLSRGNLVCFQGDNWIGNDVVDAYCRMLQFDDVSRTKLFLSPYIAEMVMCSNAKHLTHDAVIARFEPYLYSLDVSYKNVNEVKVVLWLVAYKKDMVDVDFKMFCFVMPDVPCQPNDNRLNRLPLTGRVSVKECATNPLSHPVASSSQLECPISRLTVDRVSIAVRLISNFPFLCCSSHQLIKVLRLSKQNFNLKGNKTKKVMSVSHPPRCLETVGIT
ncbi:hypothetical protein CK203_097807 [Vitis vinifera]|uniref:Uncharacterized protein n=1 Tax=Vitis vinifera TaxID=29760 RepID=A0A438D542_VITVI|nr:hypothetical protein CK203_097807 [Vitis vinifera]